MKTYLTGIVLTVLIAAAGCANASDDLTSSDETGTHSVNGSIHVPADKKNGSVSTVNGSIHVDDGATLADAQTVNGDIHVGARVTADALGSVNGAVTLGTGSKVAKGIKTVNGSVTLTDNSQVEGAIGTVNGKIVLASAHVGDGISTVNSDINIGSNSRVEGGILVKKPSGHFNWNMGEPRIVISPGAIVQGKLTFEHAVRLYVSERATIGPVSGATAIKFSGDSPPG